MTCAPSSGAGEPGQPPARAEGVRHGGDHDGPCGSPSSLAAAPCTATLGREPARARDGAGPRERGLDVVERATSARRALEVGCGERSVAPGDASAAALAGVGVRPTVSPRAFLDLGVHLDAVPATPGPDASTAGARPDRRVPRHAQAAAGAPAHLPRRDADLGGRGRRLHLGPSSATRPRSCGARCRASSDSTSRGRALDARAPAGRGHPCPAEEARLEVTVSWRSRPAARVARPPLERLLRSRRAPRVVPAARSGRGPGQRASATSARRSAASPRPRAGSRPRRRRAAPSDRRVRVAERDRDEPGRHAGAAEVDLVGVGVRAPGSRPRRRRRSPRPPRRRSISSTRRGFSVGPRSIAGPAPSSTLPARRGLPPGTSDAASCRPRSRRRGRAPKRSRGRRAGRSPPAPTRPRRRRRRRRPPRRRARAVSSDDVGADPVVHSARGERRTRARAARRPARPGRRRGRARRASSGPAPEVDVQVLDLDRRASRSARRRPDRGAAPSTPGPRVPGAQDEHPLADEHLGVGAADDREREQAGVLDVRHREADLVDVTHQPIVGPSPRPRGARSTSPSRPSSPRRTRPPLAPDLGGGVRARRGPESVSSACEEVGDAMAAHLPHAPYLSRMSPPRPRPGTGAASGAGACASTGPRQPDPARPKTRGGLFSCR